ncbi:MAG: sulfate transporter CysZ [Methylococcales bacterium]|nr:sulfate transporter CysZ [Methylococcales bacterium]
MITFTQKGNNPFYVIGCLLKSVHFLTKKQLRKFILIPIFINLLLYSLAFGLAFIYKDDLTAFLLPDWIESISWLRWLSKIIGGLIFISILIITFFTFTILANLIASPFYDKLSARTLELLIERDTPVGQTPQMPERLTDESWLKNLQGEWQRIRYLLLWAIFLLIFSLIPVINLIAPLLWGIFGAWGMALEYLAYPLDNRGLRFPEQKKLVQSVRLGALTFGGVSLLGLTIPFFNIVVSPLSVIAATIYTYGIENKSN